jgi:uncharacterized protein
VASDTRYSVIGKVATILAALALLALEACSPTNPPAQLTLLRAASAGDTTEILECLRNGSIDINYRAGGAGITPLIASADGGHLRAVSLLLERGADPNVTTTDGYSALHASAYIGDTEISKRLIAAGARVDAVMDSGGTPLWIAARHNHLGVITVLLQAGADRDLAPSGGRKPIEIAQNFGHKDAVRLLRAPIEVVPGPITTSPRFQKQDDLEKL